MENLNLIILRALLLKANWFGFNHLVRVDTFKASEYRQLYKRIEALHEHTAGDLSTAVLAADLETVFQNNEKTREALLDSVQLMDETPVLPADQLTHLIHTFLQRHFGYAVAEYVADHVESDDFDPTVVADLAASAVEIGDRLSSPTRDVLSVYLQNGNEPEPVRYELGISTKLDSGLCGGTGPGELCLFLAAPGVGKTSLLIKSGARHAEKGGTVLHITLEIDELKAARRYVQAWTGQTAAELQTAQGKAKAALIAPLAKRVLIQDWSYTPVTATDIGAKVRQLKRSGVNVSMVVVDYLGLMNPSAKGREMRQLFSAAAKEMRQLARNLNLPILSAWQVNREGSKKDLLNKADIAESWDVVMIADTLIGLNQNDYMAAHRRMKVNIIKQRESTVRDAYELYCDLDRLVVRDVTAEDHRDEVRSVLEAASAEAAANAKADE